MPRSPAQLAWRERNREKINAQDRARRPLRRQANYAAFKRKELAAGAQRRGLLFALTLADVQGLLDRRFCELCGVECTPSGCGALRGPTPSFDRVDNTVGYVLTNMALLCYRCNAQKNDMSLAEAERLVRWLRERLHPATNA